MARETGVSGEPAGGGVWAFGELGEWVFWEMGVWGVGKWGGMRRMGEWG